VEFVFTAPRPVSFAPGEAANVFRGTLGALLHETNKHAYSRIFAPKAFSGPSGLHDPPRPFVFRPVVHHSPTRFTLPMNIFDRGILEDLQIAFEALDEAGLRLRAKLDEMRPHPAVELSLTPAGDPVTRLRVDFLTATELKAQGKVLREPDFAILVARARDRISALCSIYQQPLMEIDYTAIGERAAAVQMTACQVREVEAWRESQRTGQTHSLGGFAGYAEYEGALAEFLPWLQAAQWTGVGRLTPWGNGRIRVTTPLPAGTALPQQDIA
jgi:hypothetical protein